MMRLAVVLVALYGALFLAAGCASQQRRAAPINESTSIERPARALHEEQSLADRIGEVGVVILVIGVTIGLILIPILLL